MKKQHCISLYVKIKKKKARGLISWEQEGGQKEGLQLHRKTLAKMVDMFAILMREWS